MHHLPVHPTLRHPHTGLPLVAVGIGKRGPIWPVMGASEGDGGGDGGDGGDGSGGDGGSGDGNGAGEGDLGDAGKRAIVAERQRAKDAETRAKAAEAELEKVRNANKSAEEKALDKARQEGRAEVSSAANARLVAAEVRAIAAELKFNDPRDAVVQLQGQLKDIPVDDDGEVDSAKVSELVKKLADDKKYLIAGSTTSSASDAGIGASGSGDKPEPAAGRGRLASAYAAGTKKS